MTRSLLGYCIPSWTPRFSWQSASTAPTYSDGTWMLILTMGSSMRSIALRLTGASPGSPPGPSSRRSCRRCRRRDGAVVMRSRLNSRSSRSWMISMWRRPRNPQRNPKPSASDESGSNEKAASFMWSFSSASRSGRVVRAVGREDPREDHRLHVLEAGEGLLRGLRRVRDRVADLRVVHAADVAGDEADLSGVDLVERDGERLEAPELGHLVVALGRHEANLVPLLDRPVDDADHDHGAAVAVVPGVEDEGAERGVRVPLRAGAPSRRSAPGSRGRRRRSCRSPRWPRSSRARSTASICSRVPSTSLDGRSTLFRTGKISSPWSSAR